MDRKEPVPYYGGVRIIEIEIIRILVSLRPDKVSVYRGILITVRKERFACILLCPQGNVRELIVLNTSSM